MKKNAKVSLFINLFIFVSIVNADFIIRQKTVSPSNYTGTVIYHLSDTTSKIEFRLSEDRVNLNLEPTSLLWPIGLNTINSLDGEGVVVYGVINPNSRSADELFINKVHGTFSLVRGGHNSITRRDLWNVPVPGGQNRYLYNLTGSTYRAAYVFWPYTEIVEGEWIELTAKKNIDQSNIAVKWSVNNDGQLYKTNNPLFLYYPPVPGEGLEQLEKIYFKSNESGEFIITISDSDDDTISEYIHGEVKVLPTKVKMDRVYSKQRPYFKKYYAPGGLGRIKWNAVRDDFILAGPALDMDVLGGELFLFDVKVSVDGLEEKIIFGVANLEEDDAFVPTTPLSVNDVKTANYFQEWPDDPGMYRVEIADRPSPDDGWGFLYLVVGIDENGNDILDAEEINPDSFFRLKLVDKGERNSAKTSVFPVIAGAAASGWPLAAYHLSVFLNTGRAVEYDATVATKILDGEDVRLEHRVGAQWDESNAEVPLIKYTVDDANPLHGGNALSEKIRLNLGFVDHINDNIPSDFKSNLVSQIEMEGDEETDTIKLESKEFIFANYQSDDINDLYYAMGRVYFEGDVTLTAKMVNGVIEISGSVDGVISDLYDWDYTIGHGSSFDFDKDLARIQSGFPSIATDGKGNIFEIEAEVKGEVEIR